MLFPKNMPRKVVDILIRTVGQPIVNLITGKKVMEERLCRPGIPIKDYFSHKDRNTLLRRELHSILQCIEDSNGYPCNINVTAYTLQTLVKIPVSWNGGVEIVEWDHSAGPYFNRLRSAVRDLQSKGLTVWADDVTGDALEMWLAAGVNGFKVEVGKIINDDSFVEQLIVARKPIIVERVETKEEDFFVKSKGFQLAQGFYYGIPEGLIERAKTG